MATHILIRYDTSAKWVISNPVLLAGEIGIESDTNRQKIGNGSSHWSSLLYFDTSFGIGHRGTSILDFGNSPGTNLAETTITGQVGILSTSFVQAFLMASSTSSHNSYEHSIVPLVIRCGNIITNTSFDIIASSDLRLSGTFLVNWSW